MKLQPSALLLGAALLVAAGWLLHEWMNPPAPAAIAARDSTRADVAHSDSAEADRHALDSLASARLARSETRTRASLQSAAVSGRAADSLRQVLDTAQIEADSLRRIAQATDELRRRQVDSLEAAVATLMSARDLALKRWAAADSAAGAVRLQLHAAAVRLDRVTQLTRARPLWRRLVHEGSCTGAGYAAAKKSAAGLIVGGAVCLLLR